MTLSLGLRVAAICCFVIAAVGVPALGPVGLVPLGLALYVGSTLP